MIHHSKSLVLAAALTLPMAAQAEDLSLTIGAAAVADFDAEETNAEAWAEFGYGGKLLPSLPAWLIDGKKPSKLAWFLKEKMLPPIYWHAMLKGCEWLAAPEILPMTPAAHEAQDACDFEEPAPRKAS